MIDIIYWIIYYIKCAFNLIFSYINFYINIKYFTSTKKLKKINEYLYIVKLYGSYYDMGIQYGKYMKDILKKDINIYINFIDSNQYIFNKKIPKELRSTDIFESLLNYFELNKSNYNSNIIDFMKGISKSSDIKFNDLIYVNIFNDLMDNHCILLSKKINNKILNFRTLDYGSPLFRHTLYVFNPINKIPYLSLNVCFLFGIFTGLSKYNIFFGESYYDFKIGELSYYGMPFHHISHKILSTAKNLNDVDKLLKDCKRKSNLQLLFSDNNSSRIYLSSKDKLIIQKNGNHVYSVTPKEQKNFDKNFKYLDSLEDIIKKFVPKTKSGELHIMITYDKFIYVSVTTNIYQSYNNTFYKLSIDELFK